MELSAERLKSARKDISDALAGLDEHIAVSPTGEGLAEELWLLDDSAWEPLLASLEGDELHGVLTQLRRKFAEARERRDRFFSPIERFGHGAFFDFAGGGLVVELRFVKSDGESLEVRHDLEDTLRIGASVIDSVAHVMRTMDALSADTKRRCIGQAFQENLKRAAEGVEEIERMFKAICDP